MFPFNSKIKEVNDRRGVDVNNHELKRVKQAFAELHAQPYPHSSPSAFPMREIIKKKKKKKLKFKLFSQQFSSFENIFATSWKF